MIPLFKPFYYSESFDNVKRVLRSGWTGLGPETKKFEDEFANYLGAKYVIGLNSGTEALRLAVSSALSITDYETIAITTPNTFVSTNHVLLQSGVRVVFADIDPKTGSMDIDSAKRIITKYIDKIPISILMLVHYAGLPTDIDAFRTLTEQYGIVLIEDCAHAAGARYKDRRLGSDGPYNCFSFHAVKNLSMGDGGALVTDNEEVYERTIKMRWLGIDKSTVDRTSKEGYSWDYDCPLLGYKSHMNDITAAIGRGQLLHLEEDNAYRAKLVGRYIDNLLFTPGVTILNRIAGCTSSNHLFVIRVANSCVREKVAEGLDREEIAYGYHYKPNYLYAPYNSCEIESKVGMTEFFKTAITLPLHLHMTMQDVDRIGEVIGQIVLSAYLKKFIKEV